MGAEEFGDGAGGAGDENPFLQACNDMFKEYEKVTKEGGSGGGSGGAPGGEDDL